jgi:hypothetical protein
VEGDAGAEEEAVKSADEITAEDKQSFVELLIDGCAANVAAELLGTTGTAMRKHYSGNSSIYFDPEFADQVAAAKASDARVHARLERIEGSFWRAVDKGEKWAVEKALLVYHPDFESLRHTNLRISGGIEHTARLLMPHMTTEEIFQRLEAQGMSRAEIEQQLEKLKQGKEPLGLPAPRAA